jgi:hypothetical protein
MTLLPPPSLRGSAGSAGAEAIQTQYKSVTCGLLHFVRNDGREYGVASLPSLRILKGCGNCNDATPSPVIARLRRSRSNPDAIQVRNVWIASLPSLRVLKGRGNRNDGREYGVASLPSLRVLKGRGNRNDATPTPVIARLRRSRSNPEGLIEDKPDAIQVRYVIIKTGYDHLMIGVV